METSMSTQKKATLLGLLGMSIYGLGCLEGHIGSHKSLALLALYGVAAAASLYLLVREIWKPES
jgi:hypothetical protein